MALGILAPAGVRAQEVIDEPAEAPSDDDARAREQFKLGQAAYDDGDYRSAWEHFHKAYMLSKRPELLYNVGQTADRLRKDREALKAFRMYLERLPDAENHREVENRVRVLEERVAAMDAAEGEEGTQGEEDQRFKKVSADDRPFTSSEEEGSEDALAPPAPPGAQPLRSGWYFRGALGLGGFRASGTPQVAGGGDVTLTSSTASGEVAIGHQLFRGIVVGGGLFFDFGLAPKVGDLEIEGANLMLLGVLGDWYLRPDQDGLHIEAAVAGGSLKPSGTAGAVSPEAATGGALLAGGGYEWALQDDWGLGVLARVTLARVSNDVSSFTLLGVSAQATATWF